MTARPPLISDHWFREGPVQPDGSDGYWICDYQGCGQHRGDHLQAEGDWLKPLHAVVPMRIRPSHCKACGRHHRHTTHIPWTWEQLAPITTPPTKGGPVTQRLNTPVSPDTQEQMLGLYDRYGSHTETVRAAISLAYLVDTVPGSVVLKTADGIRITLADNPEADRA